MPAAKGKGKGKGKASKAKAKAKSPTPEQDVEMQPVEEESPQASTSAIAAAVATVVDTSSKIVEAAQDFVEEIAPETTAQEEEGPKLTMEERKAKLEALRQKMRTSSKANQESLIEEASKAKMTAKSLALLEKQRKLAETLRQQAAAPDGSGTNGDERKKNWEWSIEDNDNWEKKLARKARRADFEFHDDAHAARRRYKKDLDSINPDLAEYNRQKEIAMGLTPGTLVKSDGSSSSLVPTNQQQQVAADNLYRGANSLLYGDNKPSEDAIDRVIHKINQDVEKKGKFSRKRANEAEGDITYINEHNRVFNKKIARYFDKYTTEIRASFERGTAL